MMRGRVILPRLVVEVASRSRGRGRAGYLLSSHSGSHHLAKSAIKTTRANRRANHTFEGLSSNATRRSRGDLDSQCICLTEENHWLARDPPGCRLISSRDQRYRGRPPRRRRAARAGPSGRFLVLAVDEGSAARLARLTRPRGASADGAGKSSKRNMQRAHFVDDRSRAQATRVPLGEFRGAETHELEYCRKFKRIF